MAKWTFAQRQRRMRKKGLKEDLAVEYGLRQVAPPAGKTRDSAKERVWTLRSESGDGEFGHGEEFLTNRLVISDGEKSGQSGWLVSWARDQLGRSQMPWCRGVGHAFFCDQPGAPQSSKTASKGKTGCRVIPYTCLAESWDLCLYVSPVTVRVVGPKRTFVKRSGLDRDRTCFSTVQEW